MKTPVVQTGGQTAPKHQSGLQPVPLPGLIGNQSWWIGLVFLVGLLLAACPGRAAETVTITEFLASNVGKLVDEDGDSSDWIEIYNDGNNSVNLAGWYLTDDATDLTK